MKIISFGKTTEALLAGEKTVTRRDWKDSHAMGFKVGEQVQAWDRLPRVKGAKRVAIIEIVDVHQSAGYPHNDYYREGLAWMDAHGIEIDGMPAGAFWEIWTIHKPLLWVVNFKLISREANDALA